MKLKRYNTVNGGYGEIIREELELECTHEEREMLREFLEHVGVNLCTSVSGRDDCTVYVRNAYRTAVQGWGSDLCKEVAEKFFNRNKKF